MFHSSGSVTLFKNKKAYCNRKVDTNLIKCLDIDAPPSLLLPHHHHYQFAFSTLCNQSLPFSCEGQTRGIKDNERLYIINQQRGKIRLRANDVSLRIRHSLLIPSFAARPPARLALGPVGRSEVLATFILMTGRSGGHIKRPECARDGRDLWTRHAGCERRSTSSLLAFYEEHCALIIKVVPVDLLTCAWAFHKWTLRMGTLVQLRTSLDEAIDSDCCPCPRIQTQGGESIYRLPCSRWHFLPSLKTATSWTFLFFFFFDFPVRSQTEELTNSLASS